MNYEEVLQYLYQSLPMFQRVGAKAFKKDLSNTLALCKLLNDPHQQFKSIHIAGTNGKGSSSHMLASILQTAGYSVGLYTSPHLKSFTERIKINGQEVTQQFVCDFVNDNRDALEAIKPSFFETTVAMAFSYFAEQQVDIAVIEVGLGGRLDSTNVITPELSLITNIGFDHMEFLGDTLPQIASEKAGIIKPNVPVVISERHKETAPVFDKIAKQQQTKILFADEMKAPEVPASDLKGKYQEKNMLGVLAACEELVEQGWKIKEEQIKAGLQNVQKNTGLKGRWQQLNEKPLTICDTGHNKEAFSYLMDQLKEIEHERSFFVLGFMNDKDFDPLLDMLPAQAHLIFCQPQVPRAMALDLLKQRTERLTQEKAYVLSVNEAIGFAQQKASEKDLIFIGGSTFVVAEINDL